MAAPEPEATEPVPDVRGSTLETSALLARLPGVAAYDLVVREVVRLSPSMVRLRLGAEGLADFQYLPGQDLMLAVPTDDGGHFRRRYTIRRMREGLLDLDMVLHGDGPGARFAASARPGDHVEALGPRGKITLETDAAWHLFVGDEAGLPASLAMAEALTDGATAVILLEVDGPEDEQRPDVAPGVELSLRFVHRGEAEPGDAGLLTEALGEVTLPTERRHAYLAGELRVMAALRRALLERGFGADEMSPKAYWRRGVANAAHGEPGPDD